MTVEELKDRLEELIENGYGDVEVKMAYQPNYPIEEPITSVMGFNGKPHTYDDEAEREPAVYLIHDEDGNDYAPHRIFDGDGDDELLCEDDCDDEDEEEGGKSNA